MRDAWTHHSAIHYRAEQAEQGASCSSLRDVKLPVGSPPHQSYSKPHGHVMNFQHLELCGLYVLNIQTIKQNLIKQEGTGGGENTLIPKTIGDSS